MSEQPKVIIRCLVYNHEPYLRDCLEGFVMQKTNFSFKAVVHDDCSTDGSAAIIREYAEKYPHIIEPIYETENQYRKPDGSLERIMDAATLGRSPYIAYCEGDDYWIDPLKLQKQVDYMDAHPECSMTCTNADILTPEGILIGKRLSEMFGYQPKIEGYLSTENIIEKGGGYLNTCTLVIRSSIKEKLPKAATKYLVGDYIIQVFAALNGKVYYFHEKTAVYRYGFEGSWTSRIKKRPKVFNINDHIRNINALNVLDKYSNFCYRRSFCMYIWKSIKSFFCNHRSQRKIILEAIGKYIKYNYVTEYERPIFKTFFSRFVFLIRKIILHPYYPHSNICLVIFPVWHPYSIISRMELFLVRVCKFFLKKIMRGDKMCNVSL